MSIATTIPDVTTTAEPLTVQPSTDLYPSRRGHSDCLPRQEPIVYSAAKALPPIAPERIRQYEEQGFLILENLFNQQEVQAMLQELQSLQQQDKLQDSGRIITEPGSGEVRSVFQVHQHSPVFRSVANDPRLVELANYLLGDEVYLHQSRLNYKPGFRGKEFYWHSDFETWHTEDGMPQMRALSMSITLTENYQCNGPLMVIPGSHRHFVTCEGHTPDEHYRSSLQRQEYGIPSDEQLRKLVDQNGIVSATGKPGSVILFDCNLMHGSNGNITPFPRSNAFFVYNALSNRVQTPFAGTKPRPEYICSRNTIEPVSPTAADTSPNPL